MTRLKKQTEKYKNRAEILQEREELVRREENNQALREVLHTQRLAFASSLSMVSQILVRPCLTFVLIIVKCVFSPNQRDKHAGPFDTLTHLPKDPNMRHIALLRMKHERLQRAYEFMRERQRFMDVTKEFCDQKKFQATNGDLCSERFEVVPLPEAQSVKAIVDALEYFVYNIEISMSEVLGDITIRENLRRPTPASHYGRRRLADGYKQCGL